MKKIRVISGSRADYGLLEWPVEVLKTHFDVKICQIPEVSRHVFGNAASFMNGYFGASMPDCALFLGDRFEILAAAVEAHLLRIPIAHLCGGDITKGSYDDAMRDCISRLATYHFPTSHASAKRLTDLGYHNVHMVGSTAIDYIRHCPWKKERPYPEPYVVVSYQAETIDADFGAGEKIGRIFAELPEMKRVIIRPNPDRGSDLVNDVINGYERVRDVVIDQLPHDEFLNLIYHCEEFIGNSSSMLYEAPELGVKTRMIGKRQESRVMPWGDGKASERICEVLCQSL